MKDTYRHKGLRRKLVETLREKGIRDEAVLKAMLQLPRHFFMDKAFEELAYEDKAFPIGSDQTISQPLTVAIQTCLLEVKAREKVLEIKKEINDTVAPNHTSVADKLRANTIQKLAESIALNERFLFSNELFNGNMEAFKRALTELDHIASLADAERYINIQLKEENQWNMESETVEKFITLIKRRFN